MKQADKTTSGKTGCCTVAGEGTGTPCSNISPEERHNMVATAAYYRAESRGFAEGGEQEDWLAAEAEIDGRLKQG